jgi:isoleucyl-tRNA synthetase
MPKLLRAALSCLLLVLAVAATGCGGDVKKNNAYVDAVNKAQNEFATTFDKLNEQITSTSSPKQDRATLKRFQAAIDSVVADLKAVDTPSKVKPLHKDLIAEISSYGGEIAKARTAFASSDPAKVIAAQTQLVTAVTSVSSRINSTIDQINKKLRE